MKKSKLLPGAVLLCLLSATAWPNQRALAQEAPQESPILLQKEYVPQYKVQRNFQMMEAAPTMQVKNPEVFRGVVLTDPPQVLLKEAAPRPCGTGPDCYDDDPCTINEECNYDADPPVCVSERKEGCGDTRVIDPCQEQIEKFGKESPETFCCQEMAKGLQIKREAESFRLGEKGGAEGPGSRLGPLGALGDRMMAFDCCVEKNKGKTPDQFAALNPEDPKEMLDCRCRDPRAKLLTMCLPCLTAEQDACLSKELSEAEGATYEIPLRTVKARAVFPKKEICQSKCPAATSAAPATCERADAFTWLRNDCLNQEQVDWFNGEKGKPSIEMTLEMPREMCEMLKGTVQPTSTVSEEATPKARIIQQTGEAALAQTNQTPSQVLTLLGDTPPAQVSRQAPAALAVRTNIGGEKLASGLRINRDVSDRPLEGDLIVIRSDVVPCLITRPACACETPPETPKETTPTGDPTTPIVDKPPVSVAASGPKPILTCFEGEDMAVNTETGEVISLQGGECPTLDLKIALDPKNLAAAKRLHDFMKTKKADHLPAIRQDTMTFVQDWVDGKVEYPVKPIIISADASKEKVVRLAEFKDKEKEKEAQEFVRKNFHMKDGRFEPNATATASSLYPGGAVEEIIDDAEVEEEDSDSKKSKKDKDDKEKGPPADVPGGNGTIVPGGIGGTTVLPDTPASLNVAAVDTDVLMNEFKAALETQGNVEGTLVPQVYAHAQGGCGGCRISAPGTPVERGMPAFIAGLVLALLALTRRIAVRAARKA